MGTVNFYLKNWNSKDQKPINKQASNGKYLIYLKYKYAGLVLVFTFGQTIEDPKKNWNGSKQRVKNNQATTADGKHSLNDLLDNLVAVCEKAYNKEISNGIPPISTIKSHLIDFMNQQTNEKKRIGTFFDLVEKFTSGEIKYNGKTKSKNTLANYNVTLNTLKAFSIERKYPLDWNTIDLDFYNKFIDYLEKRPIGPEKHTIGLNTIGRYIKDIKTFMSEGVDRGLTNNFIFKSKKFKCPGEETDAVYLTEQEINKLYKLNLEGNKRLEPVRDLFVFASLVALRWSDYSTIKNENIVMVEGEYFIKLITKKTNDLVIIPCHPIVLEIFKKYGTNGNMLPKAISQQKFNEYIKEIAKLAGLTEVGRLSTDPKLPLYKCLSSHTSRRSAITNYYLQGFPIPDLMKISSHRSEKTLMKYIKVTKLDTAKRLNAHIKKNWSEKLLRVA